jgi:two-component system response regulator YesN
MYSVLIVDDEPLILSGVKHLIHWEQEDCEVAGTARDGKSADVFIASRMPDIVICDINMPGMNGIELLKKADQCYPDTVFIMLTCLEEFTLAKEAMRYGAVDYILKTELDEQELRASLGRAKGESDARRKLSQSLVAAEVNQTNDEAVRAAMLSRIYLSESLERNQIHYFRQQQMDKNILLMQVLLTLAKTSDDPFDCDDFREKTGYAIDIVTRIISSIFPSFHLISRSASRFFSIYFYISSVDPLSCRSDCNRCAEKIKTSLNDMVGIDGNLIVSSVAPDIMDLEPIKAQITALKDCFFILGRTLFPEDVATLPFSKASLETVSGKVIEAMYTRQNDNFEYALNMFMIKLRKENYPQNEVIWRCEEMVSSAINSIKDGDVSVLKELKAALSYISTLDMLFLWISHFHAALQTVWNQDVAMNLTIAEKARLYINANIRKRLYLSDVAKAVNVSPGYLSSTFPKQCGMSVVEYINKTKTEEAMRMIRKEPCKIMDLGTLLGFENSYYFSKVFKKYAHMSPTDYQEKYRNA